jgi:hypothetical protein
MNFTYRTDLPDATALSGWDVVCLTQKGEMVESYRATEAVVDLEPKYGPGDFRIKFPASTSVWDNRGNKAIRMISNADGTLTRADFSKRTATGRWLWWLCSLAVVIAAVAGVLIRRSWAKRRAE